MPEPAAEAAEWVILALIVLLSVVLCILAAIYRRTVLTPVDTTVYEDL